MPQTKVRVPPSNWGWKAGSGEIIVTAVIPQRPQWTFAATYSSGPLGGLVLRGLDVRPTDPAVLPLGGLTTTVLRSVPLRDLFDELWLHRASDIEVGGARPGRPTPFVQLATGVVARKFRALPRAGRAGRDDHDYAVIAAAYVELCAMSRRPVAELADQMGFDAIATRDKLAEARKRGLLETAGRGRPGGQLTPKAIALLLADEGDQS